LKLLLDQIIELLLRFIGLRAFGGRVVLSIGL